MTKPFKFLALERLAMTRYSVRLAAYFTLSPNQGTRDGPGTQMVLLCESQFSNLLTWQTASGVSLP